MVINKQLYTNMSSKIDLMFNDYSKLAIIRLDLGIRSDCPIIITHDFMVNAFTRLRNNIRHNQMFNHLIFYISKLEYGTVKGWHYHTIFFFDGQYVQRDIWLSQQIGDYWNNTITSGLGVYYSANMHQQNYLYNGIGMIHYSDVAKINNLKLAAAYLTKVDQNIIDMGLVDASGKQIRTFNMSHYKPKNNILGRPRMNTNHMAWDNKGLNHE